MFERKNLIHRHNHIAKDIILTHHIAERIRPTNNNKLINILIIPVYLIHPVIG